VGPSNIPFLVLLSHGLLHTHHLVPRCRLAHANYLSSPTRAPSTPIQASKLNMRRGLQTCDLVQASPQLCKGCRRHIRLRSRSPPSVSTLACIPTTAHMALHRCPSSSRRRCTITMAATSSESLQRTAMEVRTRSHGLTTPRPAYLGNELAI
jgi:hypothetical protein